VALAPNATLFYEFENFSPEQRALVMKFMRDIYEHFLEGVSQGRGLPVEKVDSIGKGRVYLGARAKELGLVDELGGLDKAVAVAKQLANIPADQSVQFVVFPRPKTPFQQLSEWMQVQAGGGVPAKAWLDPTRSPLWKEKALVLVPFELEPR
jgi:protease-4